MKHLLISVALLISTLPVPGMAAPDLARLVQLIDYIGVDYRGAIAGGQVINAAEYEEMQDFARSVVEQTAQLPPGDLRAQLQTGATTLARLVDQREAPATVAAAAATLRHGLIDSYAIKVVPRKAPQLERAQQLYADNCTACHGASGHGDGNLARGMQPPPTDFTDAERYSQRTLYGLYSTISAGVADTAMRGFPELSEDDRWSLAFLVGRMAVVEPTVRSAAAESLEARATVAATLARLERFTVTTPEEARAEFGPVGGDVMAHLRTHPELLFANGSPLDFSRQTLAASRDAFHAGDRDQAYQLAVSAYLDGFELIEHRIDTVDSDLRRAIETGMTRYRNLVRKNATAQAVDDQAARIHLLLDQAAARMDSGTLSKGAAFSGAFIILLREGLEALLVVAALAAFLIKTARRDAMPYLHIGWAGALVLGVFTWLASVYLIDFSGASREITEGVAAIVAMAVLFYVGFWLHSKTSAAQWKVFIERSVQNALSGGTLWGLAGLSFIAVYREVFETILFYQALWVQADAPAQASLLAGIGTASAALAVLAWLILRYSTRLPLRQFFSVTSIFMFVLAVVFAGKGIAALQEAGKLPLDPVSFPRIDLLGIYPNLQGLALQL
ncbi:MAG: cytochrome c/FTR1 family iron permease, partial [Gammaproteobacteria bacterium]